MTDEQMAKMGAMLAQGPVSPQPSVGNRPSAPLPGMRPAVPPDDVPANDVRPDYSQKSVPAMIAGRNPNITTPEASAASLARQNAEDPIKHDPLAGMIVQGLVAQGAGTVIGAGARALAPGSPLAQAAAQNAATGAVATPEHPVAGAAMGLLNVAPRAAQAADNAIGEAALNRVTNPAPIGSHKIADTIGGAAGTFVGHKIGGPVGAIVGGVAGSQARRATTAGVDAVAQKLAARHVARLDALRALSGTAAEGVPMPIDAEVTVPEKYVPIQQTADAKVAELEANAPFNDPAAEPPSLKADVIRDAAKFRSQPYSYAAHPEGSATRSTASSSRPDLVYPEPKPIVKPATMEDKLASSIAIVKGIKEARAAGTLTPEMVQQANDSGINPNIVYSLAGGKGATAAASKPISDAVLSGNHETAKGLLHKELFKR